MPLDYHGFMCPLDGQALTLRERSLYCANNHCFDLDKRGAVNLLPVQLKQSISPGDSKEMVVARYRLLESGLYQPIADMMVSAVGQTSGMIIDAGCGEGYYTQYVANALAPKEGVIGMDISKDAIQAASRRSGAVTWCVGTNKKMPMQDGVAEHVLCMFGFPVYGEFHRVLKPQGRLFMVDPDDDHLIELRRLIYPEIKEKEIKNQEIEGFDHVNTYQVHGTRLISSTQMIDDILTMTPHGYRTTTEQRQHAHALVGGALTLHVTCRVYQKR